MLENLDLSSSLASREYRRRLPPVRRRLLRLQRAYWNEGLSALIAFEGWDAAGKGSAVRTLTARLEPRGYEIHPIREPRTSERQMPWLWRFWLKLPAYGSLGIFDRSWYGRVLVERVEQLVEADWRDAYRQVNDFERMLADDRYVVVKFFLHISKKEQRRRFEALERDPLTAWQVESEDWHRHELYESYLEAVEDMLAATETEWAPWHLVAATNRNWSRMTVLESVADRLESDLVRRGLDVPSADERPGADDDDEDDEDEDDDGDDEAPDEPEGAS